MGFQNSIRWLIFKDEEGDKVRRDEALAKNYFTGNYGTIPALKPMKMLKGRM